MNADKEAQLISAVNSALAGPMDEASRGRLKAFLQPNALVLGDATVEVMTATEFLDWLDFQRPMWESLALRLYSIDARTDDNVGIVTAYYTLRGKPENAGFRLRHGVFSVTCAYDPSSREWSAYSLVLGPLGGHIEGASPT